MDESPIITIFKNDVLEISCRQNLVNETKSVKVHVLAKNPVDGETYSRYAGWISRTLALHGGANTPDYAYSSALSEISANNEEIRKSLISFGRYLEQRDCSGIGVSDNVAHPKTDAQRNYVKMNMQINAPEGTNHL